MKFLIATFAVGLSWAASAQSSLDRVLQSVARTNVSLKAERQFYEARRAEYRTGLAPADPFVEYDFLPGRPEGAGIQQEVNLTQSFDFPAAYARRRAVARQQTEQTASLERMTQRDVLLEAKRTYLQLVYYNIRQVELTRRQARAAQLTDALRQQLAQGAATALDVAKADLHGITVEHELRQNGTARRERELRLTELNGGEPLQVPDTLYPALPDLPPFATLDSLIEATDPEAAARRQQVELERQRVRLNQALRWPRLEVGYHFQTLLGVRYQGVHMGLSIPLWQQARTVQAQRANVRTAEARLVEHRTEHHLRNQRLYEQYLSRRSSAGQYRQALAALPTPTLLETALRLRQVTVVEYLLETTYFYTAQDALLEAERDMQLTLADVLAFQL
jgi:cobalt-zinc-cadmium efflux system outer membrane protein